MGIFAPDPDQLTPEEEQQEIAVELERVEAEMASLSLKQFVYRVWEMLEPGNPLRWNWHLDVICRELEAITNGTFPSDRGLLVNIPPGSMKSLLISVLWPAWEWTRYPGLRYISASYGARLAIRDTMKMRDIVTSPWYARVYGVGLSADQSAKTWYTNDTEGWRLATSTKGEGTGEHPDRLIIDDPHKADEVRSDVSRQSVLDWYDRTISTRGVSRGVKRIIVMQRLHEEDLTAHVLTKGKWRHICFPMRYDPKRPHPDDPRRIAGELLWPEMFDEEKVRALELALGPYGTAGQLQQQPAPEGGGLFKRSWFKTVEEVPVHKMRRLRGWDTAASEGKGDYTVGVRISYDIEEGKFYIDDVVRGQWSPRDVDDTMAATVRRDGKQVSQKEQLEPGSAGKMVIAKRARDLVGFDYGSSPTTGDKVTRAKPYRAQVESGNVYLKKAPWNEAFLQEHEVFPNGKNDDQVDAASTAFNELVTGPRAIKFAGIRWG
jgi:predicted phage terminase large subunit-like protein